MELRGSWLGASRVELQTRVKGGIRKISGVVTGMPNQNRDHMEGLFPEISIISPDLMDSGQINRCCEEIREEQLLD